MIAKESLPGKIKIETHVHIKEGGAGLGFLLNLKPLAEGREFFQDSFLVWIGSEKNPGCFLFRSNVELLSNPNLCLKNQLSHALCIEKTDHHIRLYIDNSLAFDYLSHTPFHGPHFGVVLKDADLELGTLLISKSSPNILINCLSVPDTLLSLHHFKEAFNAYKQIAQSFAGRSEGREALFRAGIVLLEESKRKRSSKDRNALLEQALEEFSQLKEGAGSPLEYLGKSLVYKDTFDLEEEVKCLELALRKFTNHPLISLIKDQILFRLHEASYKNKIAAYEFSLLTLRYIPEAFTKPDNQKLLQYLQKNCTPILFLPPQDSNFSLTLHLSFHLGKPRVLWDILSHTSDHLQEVSILYCLLALEGPLKVEEFVSTHPHLLNELSSIFAFYKTGDIDFLYKDSLSDGDIRQLLLLLSTFYIRKKSEQKKLIKVLPSVITKAPPSLHYYLVCEYIGHLFYSKENKEAIRLLKSINTENDDNFTNLLEGCALIDDLSVTKEHFAKKGGPLDLFLSHSPKSQKEWLHKALFSEKITLWKDLYLLYQAANLSKKSKLAHHFLLKEYQNQR
jgi:hypothetical protein